MLRSTLTVVFLSIAALVTGAQLNAKDVTPETPELTARGLVKRSCDQRSWKASREQFTMTANGSQALIFGITGPSRILVTKPRKASWSNTMGLSFDEARSLNTGLELRENAEDAREQEVIAIEHQNGYVAFTPILLCVRGTATCNGAEVSGDICTPRILGEGSGQTLDGVLNVVTTS